MAGAPSEVMAAAWKGRIPIMFVLAEDEASEVTPTPFFSLASRYSYLPSVSRAAVESFKESAVLLGPGVSYPLKKLPISLLSYHVLLTLSILGLSSTVFLLSGNTLLVSAITTGNTDEALVLGVHI